jgi:hypothetical protein
VAGCLIFSVDTGYVSSIIPKWVQYVRPVQLENTSIPSLKGGELMMDIRELVLHIIGEFAVMDHDMLYEGDASPNTAPT